MEVVMRIDSYTKFVLTVIALCLIWLSLGGPALLPVAKAQGPGNQGETRVLITGWVDKEGAIHGLANGGYPGMPGLPVVDLYR
jgi:hypothetical protein